MSNDWARKWARGGGLLGVVVIPVPATAATLPSHWSGRGRSDVINGGVAGGVRSLRVPPPVPLFSRLLMLKETASILALKSLLRISVSKMHVREISMNQIHFEKNQVESEHKMNVNVVAVHLSSKQYEDEN